MSVFLFVIDYLQRVNQFEVLIVGGGLAGLTAALDLANRGKQVLVIEKNKYPLHKVCGEYVSNEVKPCLEQLGFAFQDFDLPKIDKLRLSTSKGNVLDVNLPLGGFGISRHKFDLELYELAKARGVEFIHDTVVDIQFRDDLLHVELSLGQQLKGRVVLGAYGKRSNLDVKMKRGFTKRRSPWLAVKGHYLNQEYPSNLVSLHNFPGGYGGLSRVEDGKVNFCYLVRYEYFKQSADIASFNENVVSKNPQLRNFLSNSTSVFEKPLTIAQISFDKKQPVENHILMCGDTAGLIHPLCGNGMAMAIHSAKLAVDLVISFLGDTSFSRNDMERTYKMLWYKNFRRRLWMGRQLQGLMMHTNWFNLGMNTLANSELLVKGLIRRTHGTPILS